MNGVGEKRCWRKTMVAKNDGGENSGGGLPPFAKRNIDISEVNRWLNFEA